MLNFSGRLEVLTSTSVFFSGSHQVDGKHCLSLMTEAGVSLSLEPGFVLLQHADVKLSFPLE